MRRRRSTYSRVLDEMIDFVSAIHATEIVGEVFRQFSAKTERNARILDIAAELRRETGRELEVEGVASLTPRSI